MSIEKTYVVYADDIASGAAIMENLIEQGVRDIHATKDGNVYRIEYKVEEEE